MSETKMMTGKTVGCDRALVDMDKATAMVQELDSYEMERIAGGLGKEWCLADYYCVYVWWHDGICALELPFTTDQDPYQHQKQHQHHPKKH